MWFDEVEIFFYEFGYGLYGLLMQIKYFNFFGVDGLCDYIEFLVQILEYWVGVLEMLVEYVLYNEIGEVILFELIEKMCEVLNYNQGFCIIEFIVVLLLDFVWYNFSYDEVMVIIDVCVFEQ